MPPRTLADGRYELLEPLGEGGMAAVYRAIDHRLGVERAVKILSGVSQTPYLRARFLREARLMARLEHPHIVSVHDVGQVEQGGDSTFIVMSLHQRGSVHAHVKHYGSMAPPQAVAVMAGVLRALVAAHSIGIVHRDIKPHNVLIDDLGNARLADFGIAHSAHDATLTHTDSFMGTWAYMAPEQRNSAKKTDARSDVYAVGAMMLHLLRGRVPHDLHNAESHAEQLRGIDPSLADFVRSCTRYRPEERYQTAQAALDALMGLGLSRSPDTALGVVARTPPRPGHDAGLDAFLSLDSEVTPDASGEGLGPTIEPIGSEIDSRGATAPRPWPQGSGQAPWYSRRGVWFGFALASALVAGVGGALAAVVVRSQSWGGEVSVAEPVPVAPAVVPEPEAAPDPEAPLPEPAPEPQPAPEPAEAVTPAPAVPQPTPGPAAPAVPTPEPPPVSEPEPPEAGATGKVTVFSLPESEVFIDGVSVGRGRIRTEVPVGAHQLRLVPTEGEPIARPIVVTEDLPVQVCWNFNEGAACSR